jgi:hypothetical protein
MKNIIFIIAVILISQSSFCEETDSDLKRRVTELEQSVSQLQQKVLDLQSAAINPPSTAPWLCKMTGLAGDEFSASGGSKSIAEEAVLQKCKASPRSSNGMHCRSSYCNQ